MSVLLATSRTTAWRAVVDVLHDEMWWMFVAQACTCVRVRMDKQIYTVAGFVLAWLQRRYTL
jgi:hypothetical protein